MNLPVLFPGQAAPALVILDKVEMANYFRKHNSTARAMIAFKALFEELRAIQPKPQSN